MLFNKCFILVTLRVPFHQSAHSWARDGDVFRGSTLAGPAAASTRAFQSGRF